MVASWVTVYAKFKLVDAEGLESVSYTHLDVYKRQLRRSRDPPEDLRQSRDPPKLQDWNSHRPGPEGCRDSSWGLGAGAWPG